MLDIWQRAKLETHSSLCSVNNSLIGSVNHFQFCFSHDFQYVPPDRQAETQIRETIGRLINKLTERNFSDQNKSLVPVSLTFI